MGCAFCASALHGLVRDLTAGEMLSQVYEAERATGEKINHIVVMGMGEPFDNYENLKRFLELLHHQDGKNLSYRHMTVSTSGILPGIQQFAEDFRKTWLFPARAGGEQADDACKPGVYACNFCRRRENIRERKAR